MDLNYAYATYLVQQGEESWAYRAANATVPPDMISFLEAGKAGLRAAHEAVSFVRDNCIWHGPRDEQLFYAKDDIRFLAPLPRPRTIRDFSTFEEHQRRVTRPSGDNSVPRVWYELPVYWKANPDNVIGPDEPIHWPSYSGKLDFELELACVIGRTGRNIPVELAGDYIAGYTIFNDVTARDRQAEEVVMTFGPAKGKDFDSAKVLGPCLVTPDEFGDQPHQMCARVNGETWSRGSSGDMFYSFARLIAYISQDETLHPGDLLGSGACPTGCGLELGRWIQPGDVLELEIEGIGVLRNRVVCER
jgi:2-keto-4-pentenoate hydratase/2-oxohepta-3-ene-1,7-dioic acid hydratase in catechol pathway